MTGFRFGSFELDLASARLTKAGLPVRIKGQPLVLLQALVERPGALISRQELGRRLWGAAASDNARDHGLDSAVNRLRAALGDDASNPLFVETVARRGYRFIAPLVPIGPGAPEGSAPGALRRWAARFAGR